MIVGAHAPASARRRRLSLRAGSARARAALRVRRAAWERRRGGRPRAWLVALTSIHWREAWKYGERAFRYCQHDLGHAIAAVAHRRGAAPAGARRCCRSGRTRDIAALTGIDRDEDYVDAEREEPACLLASVAVGSRSRRRPPVASRARRGGARGQLAGRASQLSEDHVQWTFIDEIAARDATIPAARSVTASQCQSHPTHADYPVHPIDRRTRSRARSSCSAAAPSPSTAGRRSTATAFFAMLSRVMPRRGARRGTRCGGRRGFTSRCSCIASTASRPGLYLLRATRQPLDGCGRRCGREFLWEPATDALPLYLLARGDCRALAARVSCDQDIAADGFFSLGMLADFDASLEEFGPSFYRHLFWESGVVGQVLYLEAEAAGARGTGIGCFYDDPVARRARPRRPRVPEPLSLHDRHAGRGHETDDRAGIRLGTIGIPSGQWPVHAERGPDRGARRPVGKARRPRIPAVFEEGATQPGGMPRPRGGP